MNSKVIYIAMQKQRRDLVMRLQGATIWCQLSWALNRQKRSAKDCSAYSHGTICTRMTRTNQDESCRCHCILLLMKTTSKWFHRDPFWHKIRAALAAVCSHVQNWTRQSQIVDVKFNETLWDYIHTLTFDSKDVVGRNTKNCVFILLFHPSIFVRHLYS